VGAAHARGPCSRVLKSTLGTSSLPSASSPAKSPSAAPTAPQKAEARELSAHQTPRRGGRVQGSAAAAGATRAVLTLTSSLGEPRGPLTFNAKLGSAPADSNPTTSVDPAWRRIQSLPRLQERDAGFTAGNGSATHDALHKETLRGHTVVPVAEKAQQDLASVGYPPDDGSSVTRVARKELAHVQPSQGVVDPSWPKLFGVYLVPEQT